MNRIVIAVALAACAMLAAASRAAEIAPAPAAAASVPITDAYASGAVEVSVYVVPGYGDGRKLRLAFRNRTADRLRVTVPKGAVELVVGEPIPALYVYSPTARTLSLPPGRFADPLDLAQTGTLRALDGTFWLYVDGGKPQFRGEITTGNVGP